MPRLTLPPDPTPAQSAAIAEATAGRRGRVPAPMIAWLRNPELARRAAHLGELLRYQTSLPPRLSELAILVTARHWTSHHEWTAHKREALKAGLPPATVAAIAARQPPPLANPAEQTVHDLATTLLATRRVPAPLYAHAVATLGEPAVVELVALLGYYSLVALTLNAFELGLPENRAPELEDPAP